MSMVINSYVNNLDNTEPEIVDLITSGFTRMLRSWWDNYLTQKSRDTIKYVVVLDDEGIPIFEEKFGKAKPDGANTLIFTIIKHFVGTLSNIEARVHDQLSNLRCPTLSDFRWYEDVFVSRVMLRPDCNKSFWTEKFVNGLPNLFAHKIREALSKEIGIIEYDSLTYGDLINTIQKEGLQMCIDMKISKQLKDDKKKAKYEMSDFCEQYGLPSVAPSSRKHKSHKLYSQSKSYHKRSKKTFPKEEFYNKKT